MNRFSDNNESQKKLTTNDEKLNKLLNDVVNGVKNYSDHLMLQISKLSDIGRALSCEHDINALLEMICDHARKFTHADACTLYIIENNSLHFKIVQSDSMDIRMGGRTGQSIPFPPVEMKETNVSAFVALKGVPVNIPDVYDTDLFDFTGPKQFDETNGYRSKSMLVIPMRNHENDIIGVLQLLNAKNPSTGDVISFSPDFEHLTESLASQAAIAITNAKLITDMENLFESFAEVMATAIDEKSPITGGHIRRVANLTLVMAQAIHDSTEDPFKDVTFSSEKFNELRVAAWMHDIGKVTTPVEIIEKSKKLETIFDRAQLVDLRMQFIIQQKELEGLLKEQKLNANNSSPQSIHNFKEKQKSELEHLNEIRQFILKCNEPSEFLDEQVILRLKEISNMTYKDIDGNLHPYLTDDELENLSIQKGSITEAERQVMKNHAQVTLDMLRKIPFTKKLKNIPNFAGAHHECLNGQGYPLGLKGEEIPFEGKLMAVTDIAEALTACDRPYKKTMPMEKVNQILREKVKENELDHDLVEFFIKEEIYNKYLNQYENK